MPYPKPSPDKMRFPRADALAVAAALTITLQPYCHRLAVAGSLRREKAKVSDIEIVYVPKFEERRDPDDMFTRRLFNLADEAIEDLETHGLIGRRLNKNGSQMWGEKNKLAIHLPSRIPVDLFRTDEENWFNYLVCRTGPASLNEDICVRAKAMGWTWRPYGAGFDKADGSQSFVCKSERAVFEFVNIPYKEPKDRV